MSAKELIAGYAAYTDAAELGTALHDGAPAVSASSQVPTTVTITLPQPTTVPSITFTPPSIA